MKVVLIQGLLAPYRYIIFEELAKTPGWDFEVWFMGKKVKNRIWEQDEIRKYAFKHKFLRGITLNFGRKDNYPFWVNPEIFHELFRSRPNTVIMMGWDSVTSFAAHAICKLLGIKFVLYSDSTKVQASWRRYVTLPLVKAHIKTSDALIAGGSESKHYLESMGSGPEKIFVSYNTVDVQKYKSLSNRFKKGNMKIRRKLGIGNKKVILYYAQLIERKGPDVLLSAFKRLRKKYKNVYLLMIGDGYYRGDLIDIIKKGKIADVAIIPNPGDEEVIKYYSLADIFVLPSREDIWGLVVNEAMASSLPVIVSSKADSSHDLVRNGINGYVFKSENTEDLYSKIERTLFTKNLAQKMAANSLKIISLFTPELTVEKFREAVGESLSRPLRHFEFDYPVVSGMVSVIVPEYKDKKGLRNTLFSLKKQKSGINYEVMVGHDSKGEGSYLTRNKALKRARGEFIAFIDAGSEASKNWLARGVLALNKHDYVGGSIEIKQTVDKKISDWLYSFEKNREFAVAEFMSEFHFTPTTNLFVKRKVIENLGAFDDRLESFGDLEFGDRVYTSGLFLHYYSKDLVVRHPARTFREQLIKQARLARGVFELGKYYPKRFPGFKFSPFREVAKAVFPPFWLFTKEIFVSLGTAEKIKVFLLAYLFSFIQHSLTIYYGLLRMR